MAEIGSGYLEPGTYIQEVITPAAISIATVPDVLAIVAHGNRSKRSTNEAVKRGQIFEESLTLSGASPHTGTLVNRSDRRVSNTTVRRTLSGDTITLPDSSLSYAAAVLTGGPIATVDISSNLTLGLKMDSGQEITIELEYNAAPAAPVITGSLVTVQAAFSGVGGNAATRAEIAAAISAGLAASTSLGYGALYSSAVSDSGTALVITSPITDVVSDVQVLEPSGNSGTAILGFTTPDLAATSIVVADVYYDAGATYEIDYVASDTDIDPLTYTATSITRVGSFAGVTSFFINDDYVLNAGDVDWSPDMAATFTGSITETFNISVNDNIRLALDGKSAITIDLNGLASPPPGYVNPAVPAAATAAEIATNINAVLAVAANYGPRYSTVASDVGGKVKLDSPSQGIASSIEISAPSATDATTAIFGLGSSQLPYTVVGTGNKPAVGVIYYITYRYDRPTADYNVPKRYFSEDQMNNDLTPASLSNVLAMYGQIAYENGAPSVVFCQVDDASTPGFPTVNEIKSAIDGLKLSSIITDVVVADTRINVQTYLMAHIESQSSPTEKNYRSGWFGMPNGTSVGDKDTLNTYVYRAAVTLQTAPDSPSRGRMILVAPADADRTITEEDGRQVTLSLDSTAVACAVAAKHTSFTSPAVSLAAKTITGFDAETFTTYVRAERNQLAQNGVLLVHQIGGVLKMLDPVTTEAGGGNLAAFKYRSTSSQKDSVTRLVEQIVTNNLLGVVPDDLADFIFDIKVFVGAVLTSLIETGAIGPFRDANGVSRDIDLSKDVQAEQSATDPTKFLFRYTFFLRYPALRFIGQFSVDAPFA